MKEVEYRVRPVDRFIVTRWYACKERRGVSGGCDTLGMFDSEDQALKVMTALATMEVGPSASPPLGQDGKSIRWTQENDSEFA